METDILDTLENGLLIVEPGLDISFWNRWLAVQTGISKGDARGRNLSELFPQTDFTVLKRKIRIALKLKSPTFTNAAVEKFIIPIERHKITKSIFRYMRQDAVITPLDDTFASILIYDASPLLEANAIIEDQLKMVEKQAMTDSLTQCYNKAMFNKLLASEIKKADRHNQILSMIIFDIDNFKSVNDTFGHLMGDHVLREIAAVSAKNIRESDIFARWGGEEFCVLLPATDLNGAACVAEKLRQMVGAHDFGPPGSMHCSFGVAQYSGNKNGTDLVLRADEALYHAKENGKNQVVLFAKDRPVRLQAGEC